MPSYIIMKPQNSKEYIFMNREFDFIDLYYLNDVSEPAIIPEDFTIFEDNLKSSLASDVIKITDDSEVSDDVVYTYAKFMEILDTQGLEGLVNT